MVLGCRCELLALVLCSIVGKQCVAYFLGSVKYVSNVRVRVRACVQCMCGYVSVYTHGCYLGVCLHFGIVHAHHASPIHAHIHTLVW